LAFIDGTTTDNKIAKALASNTGWNSSTIVGSVGNTDYPVKRNVTGFTTFPGGYRNGDGKFYNFSRYGFWWSSSENGTSDACCRFLSNHYGDLSRDYVYKPCGLAVRCVRD